MWKRFWSLFIPQQLSSPVRRVHFYTYFSIKQKLNSVTSCISLKLIVVVFFFIEFFVGVYHRYK